MTLYFLLLKLYTLSPKEAFYGDNVSLGIPLPWYVSPGTIMWNSGAGAKQTTMTERLMTVLAIPARIGELKTAAMGRVGANSFSLWLTNCCIIRVNVPCTNSYIGVISIIDIAAVSYEAVRVCLTFNNIMCVSYSPAPGNVHVVESMDRVSRAS